jgi:hypothetical protein
MNARTTNVMVFAGVNIGGSANQIKFTPTKIEIQFYFELHHMEEE